MTTPAPARVLVVEDEALIMMATVDALAELGYEAVRAGSAAAALDLLDGEKPITAMLTDVNLPDMDGQTLAAEVRRRYPNLPIVFATGYRLSVAPGVMESGPTAVLCKPYLPRDLSKALREVLGPAA